VKSIIVVIGYGDHTELELTDVWKKATRSKFGLVTALGVDGGDFPELLKEEVLHIAGSCLSALERDLGFEKQKSKEVPSDFAYVTDSGVTIINSDSDKEDLIKVINDMYKRITHLEKLKLGL